jgi:hypothetical protein
MFYAPSPDFTKFGHVESPDLAAFDPSVALAKSLECDLGPSLPPSIFSLSPPRDIDHVIPEIADVHDDVPLMLSPVDDCLDNEFSLCPSLVDTEVALQDCEFVPPKFLNSKDTQADLDTTVPDIPQLPIFPDIPMMPPALLPFPQPIALIPIQQIIPSLPPVVAPIAVTPAKKSKSSSMNISSQSSPSSSASDSSTSSPSSRTQKKKRTSPTSTAPDTVLDDDQLAKRMRRRQRNKESAQQSRQRKKMFMDELATQVQTLTSDNEALQSELRDVVAQNELLKRTLHNNGILIPQMNHKPSTIYNNLARPMTQRL